MWDVIVVGSGISGLTAAAALATRGRRVLVLEQHAVVGGLTQTFRRQAWTFATGVHYLSGADPQAHGSAGGHFRRLLDALGEEPLDFAPCANPYDIVRLPGFDFGIPHPESAYRESLHARFPDEAEAIDRWFAAMAEARGAAMAQMSARGLPGWLATGLRLWKGAALRHFSELTVADALAGIRSPELRAVLGARGGDYGGRPSTAPLMEHALVTGAYDGGSWYPVGGPGRFATVLAGRIEKAGGEVRTRADVREIRELDGRVTGVVWRRGGQDHLELAGHVVSTMGLGNTIAALGTAAPPDWVERSAALKPGPSCVSLFLGFEGEIDADGASSANAWIYESVDIDRHWTSPADEDAPALFVSFPSLKDPAHAGPHTAEVLALCETAAFDPWLRQGTRHEPGAYRALKQRVERRLLAQFARHFPELAPRVRFHEAATPVTQARFVRTADGSMYGLEMSAARLASPALDIRTPVPGLLLAGQDVVGAGVYPSSLSGLLAAAAIEPSLLRLLGA
jgi:all-trans-retinol 13,14-reductase